VVCASPDWNRRCHAGAIVIATGGIDLPLPIPGWHLSGVMGAWRGALDLEPGTEVVLLRGPHTGLGGRVPDLDHLNIVLNANLASTDEVTIHGDERVDSVTIGSRTVPASAVLLDNGLQPENTLARMTGLPNHFSAAAGGDVIVPGSVIAAQGTLLSVVGDAAGIGNDDVTTYSAAYETGRLLAERTQGGPIPVSIPKCRPPWDGGGTPLLPRQTTDDTLACPDEGITIGMVREAIARGATTVNDVKRRTRAAMASCQGRDCLWTVRALLAEADRAYTTPMTARPPVVGITVGELASLTEW
jgi:NAD(P)H-nitrite reductase large subunit